MVFIRYCFIMAVIRDLCGQYWELIELRDRSGDWKFCLVMKHVKDGVNMKTSIL